MEMLKMEFSRKQFGFIINSTARINICDGAVRSGKTFIFNIKWLDYIANGPEGTLMMVGKTIRTLENNVLMSSPGGLFEILGEGNYKYNRSNGELFIGGRKIICIGANDEKAEGKIRGITLAGAMCDEVTLYPQNFVTQLIARCSVKGAQQFWNCNPDNPNHYIKTDYIDNPKLKHRIKVWHFLMEDNPSLDPEYVVDLKLMYTGVWYKRMIEGLWVQAEGAIYDMFNTDKHVITGLPEKFDKYYIAIDYGTQNPCVFLLIGQNAGKHYVIKEYYYDGRQRQKQKTDEEYADDLIAFMEGYKINSIAVDPSAASFIAALRKKKVNITPAKNSVLDGIRSTASIIANNMFYVHNSCINTIKEFGAYSWDIKASNNGEDKPIKDNDHAMDCIRYYIFTFCNTKKLSSTDIRIFGF
jgi:PBSX family phage terminase large subunit